MLASAFKKRQSRLSSALVKVKEAPYVQFQKYRLRQCDYAGYPVGKFQISSPVRTH
jgi:hypothetical protein